MIALLRGSIGVAILTAVLATVSTGPVRDAATIALLVVLIGAPLVRVAALAVGWSREGDTRFARAGAALLVIVVASIAVAAA